MTVAAILRNKGSDVASVPPGARVTSVATALTERGIGAVLVRDVAGQVLGILSERDIVRGLAREGAACVDLTAAQLMTRVIHTVSPATPTEAAMAVMTAGRVRHLPVLDGERLVGLVSIGDVVKAQLDEQALEVDSLRMYVAGNA